MNDGIMERMVGAILMTIHRDIGAALQVLSILGSTKEQTDYIRKYGDAFIEIAERMGEDDVS